VETLKLPADKKFVKRSRMTRADGVPICVWDTYYPLVLVEGDILEEMKHGFEVDVVNRIREKHSIVVGIAKDKYSARTATFEEQELLQLLTNDPVLLLQRVSYTREKNMLVVTCHQGQFVTHPVGVLCFWSNLLEVKMSGIAVVFTINFRFSDKKLFTNLL
jgi:DNA-binding GntR family transcriptional regulator